MLGDQFAYGIDWNKLIDMAGSGVLTSAGALYGGGLPGTQRVLTPGGDFTLRPATILTVFTNKNSTAALTALKEQGTVTVISQPRLRTMNNQTAMIKVGTDTPFFSQNVFYSPYFYGNPDGTPGASVNAPITQSTYTTITIGTILSITPQISTNGSITLDISPVITTLVGKEESNDRNTTAPILDIKQVSTLVRVNDGDTIVIGGLIQNKSAKSNRKIPFLGDLPMLGKLFQGKFDAKQKTELVIFLTPTIVQ